MVIGYMRAFYYQSLPQSPLPRFQRPQSKHTWLRFKQTESRKWVNYRSGNSATMTAFITKQCPSLLLLLLEQEIWANAHETQFLFARFDTVMAKTILTVFWNMVYDDSVADRKHLVIHCFLSRHDFEYTTDH